MGKKIGWGILSTGNIAGTFAESIRQSRTGRLAAVASRTLGKAKVFAQAHGIPKACGNYPALLADPDVDAVYIATPHPSHLEWCVRAAKAGKHVLCEKPLTMNASETRRAIEAARRHRVLLLEAFAYRFHPQTNELLRLIRQGAIGQVSLLQGTFFFNTPFDAKNRLFNKKLGGGAILDIGCYPVSMARLIAGALQGKPFAEPFEVKGIGHIGRSGVDEWAAALLKFPGDLVAEVSCGVHQEWETLFKVRGSKGTLSVHSPWLCGFKAGKTYFLLEKAGKVRKIEVKSEQGLYVYEADAVALAIQKGKIQCPEMNWADSLGNARTLDLWLRSIR